MFSTRSTLVSPCASVWTVTVPPHGEVVDDGVLDEVRHHPQQELRGAAGPSRPAGDVECDPALFGEGEQRFGGFFGDEGEVHALAGEVSALAAAEQQEGLGEVDRPRIDSVQAFDEFAPVSRGVLAGDVEERPRDRQRGAQFVGGVRGEPLLLGDVGLELFEHQVERVREFTEFVLAALHADPVGQRPVPGHPCRFPDLCEWCEHPVSEDPSPRRPNTSRKTIATAAAGAKVCTRR